MLRHAYYKPQLTADGGRSKKPTAHDKARRPPADIVVYLRLGDKKDAGDTLLTFESGFYEAVLEQRRQAHSSCWIVSNMPKDRRAVDLAEKFDCDLEAGDQYSDWTTMMLAPRILVMAASTFAYFQAFLGHATEVHFPAVGFFHSRHNVCMREANDRSHFAQIRLPFLDARMVYHDIYSRNFFLTYHELLAESSALACETIMDQHVCNGNATTDPRSLFLCHH